MILSLTLIVWLAQAGVEWKIVRSSEWARRNFHGTKGMVISFAVSTVIAVAVGGTIGAVYGAAFVIAGIVGMFTNELTFNLFEGIHNTWHKTRNTAVAVKTWKNTNSSKLQDAKIGFTGIATGVISVFALIGKIIRGIGWVCTRPTAIAQWKANRLTLNR